MIKEEKIQYNLLHEFIYTQPFIYIELHITLSSMTRSSPLAINTTTSKHSDMIIEGESDSLRLNYVNLLMHYSEGASMFIWMPTMRMI